MLKFRNEEEKTDNKFIHVWWSIQREIEEFESHSWNRWFHDFSFASNLVFFFYCCVIFVKRQKWTAIDTGVSWNGASISYIYIYQLISFCKNKNHILFNDFEGDSIQKRSKVFEFHFLIFDMQKSNFFFLREKRRLIQKESTMENWSEIFSKRPEDFSNCEHYIQWVNRSFWS